MLLRTVIIAVPALAMASCTAETDRADLVRAPAVEVLGAPVNCVQTSRIRNTVVHDDFTIDFEMVGSEVYRNTLPNRCPGLGFDERFAYKTSTGQLCNVDTITVLQTGSNVQGPSCGLGAFVPVRYVADAD